MFYNILNYLTETKITIISVLVLVVVFSLIYIALRNKWVNYAQRERKKAERFVDENQKTINEKIEQIKKEFEERLENQLRYEKEKIITEKEKLMIRSDKELLVETIQTLGGYATRLDRIENIVFELTNNSKNNDSVITYMEKLKEAIEQIQDDSTKDSLLKITENIEAIKSLFDYDIKDSLIEINKNVESTKSSIGNIQGWSSFASLSNIKDSVDEIKSMLENRNY